MVLARYFMVLRDHESWFARFVGAETMKSARGNHETWSQRARRRDGGGSDVSWNDRAVTVRGEAVAAGARGAAVRGRLAGRVPIPRCPVAEGQDRADGGGIRRQRAGGCRARRAAAVVDGDGRASTGPMGERRTSPGSDGWAVLRLRPGWHLRAVVWPGRHLQVMLRPGCDPQAVVWPGWHLRAVVWPGWASAGGGVARLGCTGAAGRLAPASGAGAGLGCAGVTVARLATASGAAAAVRCAGGAVAGLVAMRLASAGPASAGSSASMLSSTVPVGETSRARIAASSEIFIADTISLVPIQRAFRTSCCTTAADPRTWLRPGARSAPGVRSLTWPAAASWPKLAPPR